MRQSSVLRSPKKEEQQLPVGTYQDLEILDDLQGFLGIKGNDCSFNEEQEQDADGHRMMSHKAQQQMPINSTCDAHYLFHWDLSSSLNMWEHELSFPTPQSTGDEISNAGNSNVKKEAAVGDYWEDAVEETKASLKLNLNYERVLEAWSNRGSLWAQHHHLPSFPLLSDNNYLGEVPSLEEERRRRESSVLRYKEKRQSRLFSKKIRYEVRKLNADKRPRLKGRFVKRTPESKTFKGE